MKALRFFVLFFLIGTDCFIYFGFSCKDSTTRNPGMVSIGSRSALTQTFKSRKLKDKINSPSWSEDNAGHGNLEDYQSVDPVPSSKASINPGPIQHGTPFMPYIPKPSPPPA